MTLSIADAPARPHGAPETTKPKLRHETIGIVGLGYVGLPVSIALARQYETVVGFDINPDRITTLCDGHDWTNEVDRPTLNTTTLNITGDPDALSGCSTYIVAVPTPVNASNTPDLGPLRRTCRLIAPRLAKNNLVIFESTVHPGATEDVCAPELERYSGLVSGRDFHIAYSPERISPGDPAHQLETVTKIVAAQTPKILERVARIYEAIVPAGVHRAPSIKVAEAAKVFENTQRDVNIALMNEFALICDKLDIRTRDVVRAAGTKWNALPFSPGLVGGHCIGVDPFYLTSKAESLGVHPDLMLASRRRNDAMAETIAKRIVTFLAQARIPLHQARVGILGLTFKENVPDMRNSKVIEIVDALREFGITPMLHDPHALGEDVQAFGYEVQDRARLTNLDLAVLAVPHDAYRHDNALRLQDDIALNGTIMDVRSILEPSMLRRDITYWSL